METFHYVVDEKIENKQKKLVGNLTTLNGDPADMGVDLQDGQRLFQHQKKGDSGICIKLDGKYHKIQAPC